MKGLRGLKLGVIGAVAIAIIGGLLLTAQVSAQDESVSIGSATAAPGDEASVNLEALDIGGEGLGAWTLDVTYDADVVSVTDCAAEQGGVCNPAFADDMIRVTGASATGLDGDTVLAAITFECGDDEGSSDLTISINVLADATIGDPQDIDASVSDGSITCEEPAPTEEPTAQPTALPATGLGTSSDGGAGLGWLVAVLAAAGVAGVVGFGALRVRSRRA